MKHKDITIVNPAPFVKISFTSTNRQFHEVKNDIHELADQSMSSHDFDPEDHIVDERDFEGDLEGIRIYNSALSKDFLAAVLDKYEASHIVKTAVARGDIDVVLAIN